MKTYLVKAIKTVSVSVVVEAERPGEAIDAADKLPEKEWHCDNSEWTEYEVEEYQPPPDKEQDETRELDAGPVDRGQDA